MHPQRVRPTFAKALTTGALCVALLGSARAADTLVEFVVVQADTLIGLSNTVLISPTAWREVAKINHIANPNLIVPGQHLRIPIRLLRGDAVSATLVSVTGPDVQAGGAPAVLGAPVAEGDSVQTGPGSSAVLALADGSRVRVPPSSLAEVAASRRYGGHLPANAAATSEEAAASASGYFAGTMRVMRGSVEIFATKVLRAKPLEVVTPTAVVGVRGTQYRVALDEAAANRTHAEVLEGVVHFQAGTDAASSSTDLHAGFGASVAAGNRSAIVAPLLDPPDLSALPERFERPIVRFTTAGVSNPLRVQVAVDPNFDQIVSDQHVEPRAEVRIVGLDDAQWYLRARQIDAQGIEGLDTVRPFVLKARPEPPAYLKPRSDAKQAVGNVDFAWAQNTDASRAHLQIAQDLAFDKLVDDRDNVDAADLQKTIADPGTYYWRLASVRSNGDHGPFGDPQRFELRPLPEPASAGRSADGNTLVFTWSGRAGDRQQVEFARDKAFTEIISKDELSGSEWMLPVPSSSGRYYFRYRSIEPDGFVTPYGAPLMVEVPRDWTPFIGLLLPFLVFLF